MESGEVDVDGENQKRLYCWMVRHLTQGLRKARPLGVQAAWKAKTWRWERVDGLGNDEQPSGQDRLGRREVPGKVWTDRWGQHVEGQAEGFEFGNAANKKLMMVWRRGTDVEVLF